MLEINNNSTLYKRVNVHDKISDDIEHNTATTNSHGSNDEVEFPYNSSTILFLCIYLVCTFIIVVAAIYGTVIFTHQPKIESIQIINNFNGDYTKFLNMYIGTSYSINISDVHDYGNSALYIGLPHAHTSWTPQTRRTENKCESPYYHFDPYFKGLRRTHWMSGSCTIDYGSASILTSLKLDFIQTTSLYQLDHSQEIVLPNLYTVFLKETKMLLKASSKNTAGIVSIQVINFDNSVNKDNSQNDAADISAASFYIYFFASDTMYNQSSIIIPSRSNNTIYLTSPVHRWYHAKQQPANFSGHHFFQSSRPAIEVGIIKGDRIYPGKRSGRSGYYGPVVAYMRFLIDDGEVLISTGCSFVNIENAERNMKFELYEEMISYQAPPITTTTILTTNTNIEVSNHLKNNNSVLERNITSHSMIEHEQNTFPLSTTSNHYHHLNSYLFNIDLLSDYVKSIWNYNFQSIHVVSNNINESNQTIIFYTSIWHSLLLPRIVSDYNGDYLSFNVSNRNIENTQDKSKPFQFQYYYDDFSMWDIFRAQMPLLLIISPPDKIRDFIASLVSKALQGGYLPIFPAWNSYTDEMIGDHCAVLITDAILKGILSVDDVLVKIAYKYIVKNAAIVTDSNNNAIVNYEDYKNGMGRRGMISYRKYGYIPLEDEIIESPHPLQQVSRTLEFAFNDYVIAQLALFLANNTTNRITSKLNNHQRHHKHDAIYNNNNNNMEHIISLNQNDILEYNDYLNTAYILLQSSENYKNIIDYQEELGFIRPKYINGSWSISNEDFDPLVHYTWLTETDSWQYNWFIPHNIENMIHLYGGEEKFLLKLNYFFDQHLYNHGNEPDHHVAYIYAYLHSSSYIMNKHINDIIRNKYHMNEQGLPGNEDAGQMSSWYIMSSIGLYSICPGCGGYSEYVIGLPMFNDIEILLPTSNNNHNHDTIYKSSLLLTKLKIIVEGRVNITTDIYIQQLIINNIDYNCNFISHSNLMKGGIWKYALGSKPNITRANNGRKCLEE